MNGVPEHLQAEIRAKDARTKTKIRGRVYAILASRYLFTASATYGLAWRNERAHALKHWLPSKSPFILPCSNEMGHENQTICESCGTAGEVYTDSAQCRFMIKDLGYHGASPEAMAFCRACLAEIASEVLGRYAATHGRKIIPWLAGAEGYAPGGLPSDVAGLIVCQYIAQTTRK